jgi:hypothetical protein
VHSLPTFRSLRASLRHGLSSTHVSVVLRGRGGGTALSSLSASRCNSASRWFAAAILLLMDASFRLVTTAQSPSDCDLFEGLESPREWLWVLFGCRWRADSPSPREIRRCWPSRSMVGDVTGVVGCAFVRGAFRALRSLRSLAPAWLFAG